MGEFTYTGSEVVLVIASNAPRFEMTVKKARAK
jgi:hypothetical protein